jgi:hypothetical protein
MAAHGAPEYSVAEGNDYTAHEQTYQNFTSLVKWVGGFVVLIVVGMAIFLTWADGLAASRAPSPSYAGGRWRHYENCSWR